MKTTQQDELRLIFKNLKTPRISGGQLIHLLQAVGIQCSQEVKKAVAKGYESHGGFFCEDFVSIADSLGYSTDASVKAAEALKTIVYKDSVNLIDLQRMISICGKPIGLTEAEASVFLMFQLGLKKGRIPLTRALDLID